MRDRNKKGGMKMTDVYVNQKDFWRLHSMGIYEWEVMVSRDFNTGYDFAFKVRNTVMELLNNVISFMNSHLKEDETVLISVYNESNVKEVEAIIASDMVIYLNGLGEFVSNMNKKDVVKY